MFERFTPEARSALFVARRAAEAEGRAEIWPEHLLTGVLTVAAVSIGPEKAAAVLAQLETSRAPTRGSAPAPEFIPFSTATRQCLVAATERATQRGHRWVRSEHILAALLLDDANEAAKVLVTAGITAHALEVSALSRPPADTDEFSERPSLHAFVVPSREH